MTASAVLPALHATVIRRTWLALFLLVAVDVAWMAASGIRFPGRLLGIILGASICLFVISAIYRKLRRDDAIWLASQLVNQLIIGSGALATFSYMGLRLNYPLRDPQFVRMDESLGFNWLNYIAWVEHHPAVARLFTFCYAMTGPEGLIILALLCFLKRFTAFHRFALSYLLGAFLTVFISNFWPALPAYVYRNISPETYPHLQVASASSYKDEFFAMRNYSMQALPENFQGIIAFPSFHSVLAVIAIIAAMAIPSRVLRIGIIALSLLMLLSTPVDGGHYLVDTLAGIALGLLAAYCARRWLPEQSSSV